MGFEGLLLVGFDWLAARRERVENVWFRELSIVSIACISIDED